MAKTPTLGMRAAPGAHLDAHINVRVTQGFRLRCTVGFWFLRVGARILGFKIAVERVDRPPAE